MSVRTVLVRLVQVALALGVLAGSFALVRWWDFTLPSAGRQQYQAVFLSNGQTFFGRYYDRLGPYAKVVQPYYIQQMGDPNDPKAPPQSRIVKRGGELHGPQDEMLVPKTSILFVEDLAPGSPVAEFMAKQP